MLGGWKPRLEMQLVRSSSLMKQTRTVTSRPAVWKAETTVQKPSLPQASRGASGSTPPLVQPVRQGRAQAAERAARAEDAHANVSRFDAQRTKRSLEADLSLVTIEMNEADSFEQFMGTFAAQDLQGRWAVGDDEARHLKAVLATFGLEATAKLPDNKGALVAANS